MAYRGRGGWEGRGGGWSGHGGGWGCRGFAKPEPYVLFPDMKLPDVKFVSDEEETLVFSNEKLQKYWESSAYYLEDDIKSKMSESQNTCIGRYSVRKKSGAKAKRGALDQFLRYEMDNFPRELIEGSKKQKEQPNQKRVRWNPHSDLHRLDLFEKLEKMYKGQEETETETEKKKGENEEEVEDERLEEDDEESSDDGDYNQNIDFDDDEDELNMEDDNEDEDTIY